jgi:hypothetical protein
MVMFDGYKEFYLMLERGMERVRMNEKIPEQFSMSWHEKASDLRTICVRWMQ